MEDIDIRVAAMEWYAAASPKEAKRVMKKISKHDENQEVRERADALLEDIDEMIDHLKDG